MPTRDHIKFRIKFTVKFMTWLDGLKLMIMSSTHIFFVMRVDNADDAGFAPSYICDCVSVHRMTRDI